MKSIQLRWRLFNIAMIHCVTGDFIQLADQWGIALRLFDWITGDFSEGRRQAHRRPSQRRRDDISASVQDSQSPHDACSGRHNRLAGE
ncbi:hypothetical protein [Nevskia soli]|uniref:hypothetical protein n=1 Tax=Nevskia soli TaxID=418856 RepID=UPI0014708069|nr:hypothetical protein [Nevskia soli]